jgi:hypothetical protein
VIEVEHEETIIVRLPAKIRIEYEFTNLFKSEKETPSKLTINVEIFLTKDEAKTLEESITDKMIEIINMIFEAKKLEQEIEATEEAFKDVFDADPA